MGDQSLKPASTPTGAVFLSYASQDQEAAQRICAVLRAGGIEVWFDQSELRGGDTWDRQIRQQIHECRLFIPVISAHTEARDEGYFRREWKLAVDRTHDMAEDRAFLVPVAIDGTNDRSARVPDSFKHVQWMRLPGDEIPPEFVARIKRLLSPELSAVSAGSGAALGLSEQVRTSRWSKPASFATVAVLVTALAYFIIDKFWISKHLAPSPPAASAASVVASPASTAPTTFNPPPNSIAVLPFVNMSGDKEQDYFSDGLSEELLNDLARINNLQVAARTSAFSFKGKDTDIGTIARKLNVGAVLEGSVRRSARTVRVTAQLINAVNGFQVWSHSYDRSLGDVLKLQTEIAEAVADALKVTLLGNVANKIKVGGTQNPAAYDAYLRASSGYWKEQSANDLQQVIARYEEAVRLDPNFALALAEWSIAYARYALNYASGPAVQDWVTRAKAPALEAIASAPDLAEGHLALAIFFWTSQDFARASEEFERAALLGPGNARILKNYGLFAVDMGHTEIGLAALRRAVVLDPLNPGNHFFLIGGLQLARRYDDSLAASRVASSIFPDNVWFVHEAPFGNTTVMSVPAYYFLGDFQKTRLRCEALWKDSVKHAKGKELALFCLALVEHKLGRSADAETALQTLKTLVGDGGAYNYAQIYAQWGDYAKALDWLETALRLHVTSLRSLKVDPQLDPLRNEPRFQAIERELKFPD